MNWIKGEPPHRDGVDVLAWWEQSRCYGVIYRDHERGCFVDAGDVAEISVPTHYADISPPT